MKTLRVLIFVVVLLGLVVNFFYSRNRLPPLDLKILGEIITNINENIACDVMADCKALAVGNKACGGPKYFIVASTKNPKFNELQTAVHQYTDLDVDANSTNGSVSTCSIEVEPKVDCINKKCSALN